MKKRSAFIILVGSLLLLPLLAFGQSLPDLPGFDTRRYDYFFDRADRELSPALWMDKARAGLLQAREAWESIAGSLGLDSGFLSAGDALAAWEEAELERRFAEWLEKRFFPEQLAELRAQSAAELEDESLGLVYHNDENGIMFDAAGDPLVKRSEGEDLQADLAGFQRNVDDILSNSIEDYSALISVWFPELAAYIPEESREAFAGTLSSIRENALAAYEAELTALAQRKERLAVARLTGDNYSLRKKSEDASPASITAGLIKETQAACEQGLDAIAAKIEEAAGETGDINLAGENWLDAYREQFEKGLAAWESAEEAFLMRRLVWEEEAKQGYADGEQAWQEAYASLLAEREKWETSAQVLFDAGEKYFTNASEELKAAIALAREEFQQDAAIRSQSGAQRAQTWVDIYVNNAGAAAQAKSNIAYWQKALGIEAPDPASAEFEALLASAEITGEQRLALREIKRWSDLYSRCIADAEKARASLLSDIELVMGNGDALMIILQEGVESEDFNLDEYQVELLRAQAVAAYWEKRCAIARELVAYATAEGAGRDTHAETLAAWEAAKAVYEEALRRYTQEQAAYNAEAARVREAGDSLDAAARALAEANTLLDELNETYALELAALELGSREFMGNELLSIVRNFVKTKDSLFGDEGIFDGYLTKAGEAADASIASLTANTAETLIFSGKGLAALFAEAENAAAFSGAPPANAADYGLAADNPYLALIKALLEDEEDPEEGASVTAFPLADALAALSRAAKASAERRVQERLDALRFLAARSMEAWYEEATGKALEEDSLEARMQADYDDAIAGITKKAEELGLEILPWEDEAIAYLAALLEDEDYSPDGEFLDIALLLASEEFHALERLETLIDIFYGYQGQSAAGERWAFENARASIGEFFAGYGLETEGLFPGVEALAGFIMTPPADAFPAGAATCAERAGVLLAGLDDAASLLPERLQTEYEYWRDSFITYLAALSLKGGALPDAAELIEYKQDCTIRLEELNAQLQKAYAAGAGEELMAALQDEIMAYQAERTVINYALTFMSIRNSLAAKAQESHWRGYVTGDLLAKLNSDVSNATILADESLFSSGTSGADALISDCLDDAIWEMAKFLRAVEIYEAGDFSGMADVFGAISAIIEDHDAEWQKPVSVPTFLKDQASAEFNYLQTLKSNYTYSGREIVRLKEAYFVDDTAKASKDLDDINEKIVAQTKAVNDAFTAYDKAGEKFEETGEAYDRQYETMKAYYRAMEDARLDFEKQDALKRWASTSYLESEGSLTGAYKSPAEELAYSNERLQRAEEVLAMLTALYAPGTEERPFADAEYETLLADYRASYEALALASEVKEKLGAAVQAVYEDYAKKYGAWQGLLQGFLGGLYYGDYKAPESAGAFSVRDFLTIKDGKLAFLLDDGNKIGSLDEEGIAALKDFIAGDGTETLGSAFAGWLERIEGYGLVSRSATGEFTVSGTKYQEWGLAGDYLLRMILEANRDSLAKNYLESFLAIPDALSEGSNLGEMHYMRELGKKEFVHEEASKYQGKLKNLQKAAYDKLSAAEKEDLEFYLILTMLGGGGTGSDYFGAVSDSVLFNHISNGIVDNFMDIRYGIFIPILRWVYLDMLLDLKYTWTTIQPTLAEFKANETAARNGLAADLRLIDAAGREAQAAEAELEKYRGDAAPKWEDIETALTLSAGLGTEEIAILKQAWEEMNAAVPGDFENFYDALCGIENWLRAAKKDAQSALTQGYAQKEAARLQAEDKYRAAVSAYINGEGERDTLLELMAEAYGPSQPSLKAYYGDLMGVITGLLENAEETPDRIKIYREAASELGQLVGSAYTARYDSELAVREAEWQAQLDDLAEKQNAWKDAAALILERGRRDWKEGVREMETRYKSWQNDFLAAYNKTAQDWDAAYLAGLKEKEAWITQAAQAADQRAADAMLSLVGSEGERLARAFDVLDPVAQIMPAVEAAAILQDTLSMAGITSLEGAFSGIGNTPLANVVRTGSGGVGAWNSGRIQAAAARQSSEMNAEIAVGQAIMLAAQARESAEAAIANIAAGVDSANESVKKSMDQTFIIQGQWSRQGTDYVRNIIVYSTLFQPRITDEARIAGYANYSLPEFTLKTDLSEKHLQSFDSIGINAMIERAFEEIEEHQDSIFGNNEKDIKGAFNEHVGDAPTPKSEGVDQDTEKKDFFADEGSGEMGRLLAEYMYRQFLESIGLQMAYGAPWDKPMWDDRDSFIDAPNLRTIVDIGINIAASTLGPWASYGIGLIDDALFGALDVAGGYKTWEEAGQTFATKAVVGALTAGIGEGFGALKSVVNFNSVTANSFANAAIGFTQSYTTSVATAYATELMNKAFAGSNADWSDWSTANKSWYSVETVAGAASAGVMAGTTTATTGGLAKLGVKGVEIGKFWGGAIELGTSLLGKAAEYGVHVAYSGGDWAQAFDNMGGLTLNIADLGTMIDMFGSIGVRNNDDGQGDYKRWANLLSGAGLQLNITTTGVSGHFGTDGINVSSAVYDMAKRGIDWASINSYKKKTGQKEGEAVYYNYVFGDYTAENTSARIASGVDELKFEEEILNSEGEKANAHTEANGRGRTISMVDVGNSYNNAILLQHEAYRDGVKDEDNVAETQRAVTAHTIMAIQMLVSGAGFDLTAGLYQDMTAYRKANGDMKTFNDYIDKTYDSSDDYWKLGPGGFLYPDGSGYLTDEEGLYINTDGTHTKKMTEKTIGAKGVRAGLLNILFGGTSGKTDFTKEQIALAEELMKKTKMESNNGFWSGEYSTSLDMAAVMDAAGNTIAQVVFDGYFDRQVDDLLMQFMKLGSIGQRLLAGLPYEEPGTLGFRFVDLFYRRVNEYLQGYSYDLHGPLQDFLSISLNEKYFVTEALSGENPIYVNKANEYNNALSKMSKQTEKDGSVPTYGKTIHDYGCVALSYIANVQMATGYIFSKDEISDILKEAYKAKYVNPDRAYVDDGDGLLAIALKKAGVTNFSLTCNVPDPAYKNSVLYSKRIYVEYQGSKTGHTVVGDVNGNILYNPSNVRGARHTETVKIYLSWDRKKK